MSVTVPPMLAVVDSPPATVGSWVVTPPLLLVATEMPTGSAYLDRQIVVPPMMLTAD